MGKKNPSEEGKIRLTLKGKTYLLAVNHRFCPGSKYGMEMFDRFWDEFKDTLLEEDIKELGNNTNQSGNKTTNNRNIPIVPILFGFVLGSIVGKLLLLFLKILGVL